MYPLSFSIFTPPFNSSFPLLLSPRILAPRLRSVCSKTKFPSTRPFHTRLTMNDTGSDSPSDISEIQKTIGKDSNAHIKTDDSLGDSKNSKNRIAAKATKWIVSGTVFALVLWKPSANLNLFILGGILNSIYAKVLKYSINQKRPNTAANDYGDPGMPSSHALNLSFIALYLTAFISVIDIISMPMKIGGGVILCAAASISSYWRVQAGFHTFAQIIVGLALGSINGVLWFNLSQPYAKIPAWASPEITAAVATFGVITVLGNSLIRRLFYRSNKST